MPAYRIFAVVCLFVCGSVSLVSAQFEDEFASGLIADYVAADGTKCRRIDPQIAFHFGAAAPDARVSGGKFAAKWDGLLLTKTPGPYTLYVYAQGKVRILIEDEVVLDAEAKRPGWLTAESIDLKFDWHPLQVEFTKTSPDAQIAIYWAGPDYTLEPITPEWLFHEIDDTFAQPFDTGRDLVRSHRCGACHGGDRSAELPAPALNRVAGHLSQPWIVDRLMSAANESDASTRKMPHYNLPQGDAEAIAAYLVAESDMVGAKGKPDKGGSVGSGKRMFESLGCLACHRVGELGAAGPFSGGDLSDIAAKRPPHFFAKWLEDPAALNADHRMPVYQLDGDSRKHLAAYLATLSKSGKLASTPQKKPNSLKVKQGRDLVLANRCDACHRLPGDLKDDQRKPLSTLTSGDLWHDACLAAPTVEKHPGYLLSADEQEAIRIYLRQKAPDKGTAAAAISGAQIVRERNCLACHARGVGKGLAPIAAQAAAADSALSAVLPTLTPPSLNSVGDKLHDQALMDIILRKDPVHRPWLKVQMPRFRLQDTELTAIKDYLVEQDRIPAHPLVGRPSEVDPAALAIAGERLVGGDGFNCTSCHAVGDWRPSDAPLNAKGPTLSMLGDRIRRDWFDRWVRKPARIVPQMEMPSVTVPVSGVLHDEIDDQLAAVWRVLNTPGFQPPKPNPVRVARRSGIVSDNETALVLTDVLRDVDRNLQFIKPLLVGLPNRHNVLFDLETGRLASWTLGDAAYERSEGKSWFWELAGAELLAVGDDTPELALVQPNGKSLAPQTTGQFITSVDRWRRNSDGGVSADYRLTFGKENPQTVLVRQTITPIWDEQGAHGFVRSFQVKQTPSGYQLALRLLDSKQTQTAEISGDTLTIAKQKLSISVAGDAKLLASGVVQIAPAGQEANFSARYLSSLPTDRYPPRPQLEPSIAAAAELTITPGWSAQRLPLTVELMPTAIAWRPNGDMVVASLKGRIWLVRDADGDGKQETLIPLDIELAAPFGLAAYEGYLDVINKYSLLRIFHDDAGHVERIETLVDGWGHTADYHDWAMGLPQDSDGAYYVSTACQQDGRSQAASKWRGVVLKLIPRKPTADDPSYFKIEELTAGHRFPIGIARNQAGELFVTDNQGNYNPFNELNHIVPGKRYGFINKIDRRPGFAPEETTPAIAIPHPWTRSVNGICFLETPAALRRQINEDYFGPFEGDLIGCEYDTRRLVRMSLDHVGDAIQGAIYPFTHDPGDEVKNALLGPIACAVSPSGELVIGNMREGGWGGGANVGSLVKMRPQETTMPSGIDEVRATSDGFVIRFTQPINAPAAADKRSYTLNSYRRQSTPAYGGDDIDSRPETIDLLEVSADKREVRLRLEELRAGFVYELHVDDSVAGEGKKLFPAEAHYTLNVIPTK
ncbi:PA14 domain-containing protein [Blastopirellula marina]|uniref:Putative large multi-functional protein n=1 Tax=Blastopirellula marina DSM 3645 TaxID=314230 RepID=A3ZT17_9BACT|nr:c-type cytochrome [Blastopirellula marina]EAQ80443.1 putative large multi-functional protein [Blastopirellula marina DSM 3645]